MKFFIVCFAGVIFATGLIFAKAKAQSSKWQDEKLAKYAEAQRASTNSRSVPFSERPRLMKPKKGSR